MINMKEKMGAASAHECSMVLAVRFIPEDVIFITNQNEWY